MSSAGPFARGGAPGSPPPLGPQTPDSQSGLPRLIEEEILADAHAPWSARRLLDSLASDIPPDCLDDVRLLVSELVTNSLVHAATSPPGPISLRFILGPGTLRVSVGDRGAGFEPRERKAVNALATAATGGWGLFLVNSLASRWGVRREEGSLVWFEVDIDPPPERPPPPSSSPTRPLCGRRAPLSCPE